MAREHFLAPSGKTAQRSIANHTSSVISMPAVRTVQPYANTLVIQACWATNAPNVPVYVASQGAFFGFKLEQGVQVKRLDKAAHYGRYKIQVLSGNFATKEGWIATAQITKLAEQEEKKEKKEPEQKVLAQPDGFKMLAAAQEEKKNKRADADRWAQGVPANMKEDKHMSPGFQDQFGGSSAIFSQLGTADLDTPPSSQGEHENESRRLATSQEMQSSLVVNFGKPADSDTATYGGNYSEYMLYSNMTPYEVKKEDRHDARLSALLFNEAAEQTESGILKAEPLTPEEEKAKEGYLKAVRKKMNMEGEGGTFMHEPDQQFVPKKEPVRAMGGSLMGTHHGTKTANALMGQVLHPKHPQHKQARQGVGSMLVKEKDGHIYRYGTNDREEKDPQSEEDIQPDEPVLMQGGGSLAITNALQMDGWSQAEIKYYLLDPTEEEIGSTLADAKETLVHYYIITKVGPTIKDFALVKKPRELYLNNAINAREFKEMVADI
jgi:hypothetical protein